MATTDASASLLGYLYQIESALTLLLEWGPRHPTAKLHLEVFDDISFEVDGNPFELAQVKFHQGSARNLTDKSVDLWKTIGIWLADLTPARRLLMTTQVAASGTAASLLRNDPNRDTKGARELLDLAAEESTNEESDLQRAAWKGATPSSRARLLESVVVIDGGSDMDEIRARADGILSVTSPPGSSTAFIDEVRGAWSRLVIAMLMRSRDGITFLQFQNLISDIRDRFSASALITTVLEPDEAQVAELMGSHSGYTFVAQLEWIGAPPSQIEIAISDFYRATEQKAHWIENSYLEFLEIENFKSRLVTEWKMLFDWAVLNIEDNEDAKIAVGRELFQQVMKDVRERIRPDYEEPFMKRGTYHEISDGGSIGWHPDFLTKVQELLGVAP